MNVKELEGSRRGHSDSLGSAVHPFEASSVSQQLAKELAQEGDTHVVVVAAGASVVLRHEGVERVVSRPLETVTRAAAKLTWSSWQPVHYRHANTVQLAFDDSSSRAALSSGPRELT